MRIVSFGSRIMDDAFNYTCNSSYQNLKQIVGISPFSFNSDVIFNSDNIDLNIPDSYNKNILKIDIANDLYATVSTLDYDIMCIDFIDASLKIWQCTLKDGRTFRCTYNNFFQQHIDYIKQLIISETNCPIIKEEIIDPLCWTIEQLKSEMSVFCKCICNIDIGRLILLDAYIPFQYLQDDTILNTPDIQLVSKLNDFSLKCRNTFAENISCKVIERIEYVIGNSDYIKFNFRTYTDEYYQYIIDSLNNIPTAESTYIHNIQLKIDITLLETCFDEIHKYRNNRKLVLIAEDSEVCDIFSSQSDTNIDIFIKYNDVYCADGILNPLLNSLAGKSKEYLFVIAHLNNSDKLLKHLWEIGYSYPFDVIIPSVPRFVLSNFIGSYRDIYKNDISISKAGYRLDITSLGSRINIAPSNFNISSVSIAVNNQCTLDISDNVQAHKLIITILDCATVKIGRTTSFADNCNIVSIPYTSILIGDDCMFASKCVCHAGDGHSIFDIDFMERINYLPKNSSSDKFKIVIDNHIWVGYQSTILQGSKLGSGSIVGARSLVNKSFPNNVICAGVPAQIIRKDVTWSRNPFTHNIYEGNNVPVSTLYAKKTID